MSSYSKALERAYSSSNSSSQSNEYSCSMELSNTVYSGKGSAAHKNDSSYAQSSSNANKNAASGKWQKAFSSFIDEGFVQVKPGTTKPFAVEGGAVYISVAVLKGDP